MTTKYYKLKKSMPYHEPGDYLINTSGEMYFWEKGQQYILQKELVENTPEWFEEDFPEWIQNEPCFYIAMNGVIVKDYFDREKHSSLVRFGNIFKSNSDAELAQKRINEILNQFTTNE